MLAGLGLSSRLYSLCKIISFDGFTSKLDVFPDNIMFLDTRRMTSKQNTRCCAPGSFVWHAAKNHH